MNQPVISYIDNSSSANSAPQGPTISYVDDKSNEKPNIGKQISDNKSYLESLSSAAVKGTQQGFADITSTIAKGLTKIAPYVGLPDMKPEDIQSYYEKNLKTYNEDPDTNAHPIISGIGRVGAQISATAPLALLTGGASAEASIGAKIGQSVLTNAAQGGLMGALVNQEGNKDILNASGAQSGAIFGGTVGAALSGGLSSYAKNLDNYEQFSKSLKNVGYKGPVFSTDVPNNQGIYNSIKESVVNGAVSKLPLIRNMPLIGTQAARDAQINGINDVLTNLANKYTSIDKSMSLNQFRNSLLKSQAEANNTIGQVSSDFRNVLNMLGINNHELQTSLPIAKDLLTNDSKVLSNQAKDALQSMDEYMNTNALLGSKEAAGLKQRIWKEYERLAGDRVDTPSFDAANKLNDLYHSINTDISNSVAGNESATYAFNRFNSVTSGIKTLWDPQNSKILAGAMRDINNDASGMVSFFNKLKNNSMSPQAYDKYSSIVGPEGMSAVQDQVLNSIFTKNMRPDGTLNVSKLLDSINKAPDKLVNSDIKDSLNGLTYLTNKSISGIKGNTSNGILETAGGAALGAAAFYNPLIQGIVASGSALGAITAHAPIKNFLIGINKTAGLNEPLSQYLINKASKYINRAGISIMLNNQDGNVHITKQDLGDK